MAKGVKTRNIDSFREGLMENMHMADAHRQKQQR